jgi:Flp pilus assembly protein TadG
MLFENFLANRSGAFGMVFALLLVPILLGVGVSVDYVFAFNAREKLQAATDSAVLAAATSYEDTTPLSDTTSMINAYLAANGDGNGELVGDPTFSSNNSQLCAVSKADISTSFMQIANIYSIPVCVFQ